MREGDDSNAPLIDMHRYAELLSVLPDKVVENLEKSRLAHEGKLPMLKAGLGYEELLSGIVVDGTAIASSSRLRHSSPRRQLARAERGPADLRRAMAL